jgi:hypothetical protein
MTKMATVTVNSNMGSDLKSAIQYCVLLSFRLYLYVRLMVVGVQFCLNSENTRMKH